MTGQNAADQIKLYTLAEVAQILRINRQTIYNAIGRGAFKPAKFGKEYRVTKEQLQDLLKNGFRAH